MLPFSPGAVFGRAADGDQRRRELHVRDLERLCAVVSEVERVLERSEQRQLAEVQIVVALTEGSCSREQAHARSIETAKRWRPARSIGVDDGFEGNVRHGRRWRLLPCRDADKAVLPYAYVFG